ncbi:MAG: hypothetical protein J07HX64_00096 [halophilic archaeon J07HX64]|nr:MAG: hypothetical protein J07HX64_00096 [halophilic archaeon J07HX64]
MSDKKRVPGYTREIATTAARVAAMRNGSLLDRRVTVAKTATAAAWPDGNECVTVSASPVRQAELDGYGRWTVIISNPTSSLLSVSATSEARNSRSRPARENGPRATTPVVAEPRPVTEFSSFVSSGIRSSTTRASSHRTA